LKGVTFTENVGKCARCGKFLIEEEARDHTCDFGDIEIKGVKEILLDRITDLHQDRNGDHVYTAWGLDGIFYRLVECKHNPPHATKRKFTGCNNPPPDKLPVYLPGGGPQMSQTLQSGQSPWGDATLR
jgi:hypothetical protein